MAFISYASLSAYAETKKAISKDGVPIAYEVKGKGEITLVFIHCWCCDRSFWKNQIPVFSKKYQVVAIDLAGHGTSGFTETMTMEAFGRMLAVVVNKINAKKSHPHWSFYGRFCMVAAAQALKNKVIGLICVETSYKCRRKMDA